MLLVMGLGVWGEATASQSELQLEAQKYYDIFTGSNFAVMREALGEMQWQAISEERVFTRYLSR